MLKAKKGFVSDWHFQRNLDNYLFFDERKQIFTNIFKIWTNVRIFLPALLHKVIPGKKQFNVILVFTPVHSFFFFFFFFLTALLAFYSVTIVINEELHVHNYEGKKKKNLTR